MSAFMDHASSSSSEDEVENQRLLDAVWDHNRKDEVNDRPNQRGKSEGNSRTKQMIICDIKKPSVREMIYQEAHEQFNEDHKNVKATPEFRRFVAKKLSSVLDGKLKMIMSKKQKTFDDDNSNKNEEDTFRLFSTSCCAPNLDTPEPPPPLKRKRPRIGRNTKKLSQANNDDNSSDSDVADQRLAEAAISGHQILSFSLFSASFNRTAEKVECNSSKDSSPHVDSKRNRTDDAVNERKVEIKDRELSEGDLPEEIVRKKKKKKKRKNVDTNGSNEDDDNEQVNTENFQTLAVSSSVLPGEKDRSELSEDIVKKRKKKKKRKGWTQCKEWS